MCKDAKLFREYFESIIRRFMPAPARILRVSAFPLFSVLTGCVPAFLWTEPTPITIEEPLIDEYQPDKNCVFNVFYSKEDNSGTDRIYITLDDRVLAPLFRGQYTVLFAEAGRHDIGYVYQSGSLGGVGGAGGGIFWISDEGVDGRAKSFQCEIGTEHFIRIELAHPRRWPNIKELTDFRDNPLEDLAYVNAGPQ